MLAKVAGYEVWPVQMQFGLRDTIVIDWGHIPSGSLVGDWSETPADPLLVLIAHADDEGHIHPEQAGPLADRLEALLPLLPSEPDSGHIGDWHEKTKAFIAGLRCAAAAHEDVEFH
jgi:hypothetical protein